MPMLEVEDVHTYYGNIEALKGISLTVEEGEIVTLIGSNGAGKSTTLRSISGLTPPRVGSIRFEDREIGETAPQEIVRLGIATVPERRELFPQMTVIDNLELGAYSRPRSAEVARDMESIYGLFPILAERRGQAAPRRRPTALRNPIVAAPRRLPGAPTGRRAAPARPR